MIRLARVGKTKKPYFRLIVSEKTKDTHGDYLEILGHVNPHGEGRQVVLKSDRVQYWLSVGAQPSASVHNLLVEQRLVKSEKLRAWKPKKKAAEVLAAEAKTKADAAKPAEVKAEEPKAEEVTPAEEAKPAEAEAPAS